MTTTPHPEKHNARLQPGEVSKADTTTARAYCFPDPTTVKGHVLADLLSGRHITHLDCWREHGSSRLAHHCYVLRGMGWPIDTEEIDACTCDGRHVQIGEYSLRPETIEEAGERGQQFVQAARKGGPQ